VSDPVNHPDHYTAGSKEFLDIAKDFLSEEQFKGALIFNIFKYLFRYERKNGIEDLLKAEFYLKRLIKLKKNRG
tara:strand:+ start:524 stop:745 length:222 start_codon:yes stop_codon:yes gene_type:complete